MITERRHVANLEAALTALRAENERLREALKRIAGGSRCDLSGPWKSETGIELDAEDSEFIVVCHLARCDRCIAHAALEAK